jgi:PIN domain nuclease of toxin-antitoxin system
MKLLLDTHVLLWWLENPSKIAEPARLEIANPRNAVYVSAVSIQEIIIKQGQNRLSCPDELLPLLDDANRFSHLPVTLEHALTLRGVPEFHKDPFDRLLLAQCCLEAMTLVTRDRLLMKYGKMLADYRIPIMEA